MYVGSLNENLIILMVLTITLFRFITMLCGIDNIIQNIPHIQSKCEEYYVKYCLSHKIVLCGIDNII